MNGGTLLLGAGGGLPATGAVTVAGTSVLHLGGSESVIGAFTLSGGSLVNGVLRPSGLTLNSGTISADVTGSGATNKLTGGLVTLNG